MATDLIARGLAASTRDSAMLAFADPADLSASSVPAEMEFLFVGLGIWVSDSLATAELAAEHPRCCGQSADERYWRLAPMDGTVTFEQCGATGSGNDRPALQAAISYAVAVGLPQVVGTSPTYELWEPERTLPLPETAEEFYIDRTLRIPACVRLEIDFGGALITLKGPAGGDRFPGQTVSGGVWLGGFITLTGEIERLRIANVDVDGGFTGDTFEQTDANLNDKGFMAQDLECGTIVMENVVLHGFAGEIMYDNSFALHVSRDCHFYNSGHSCWNPSGLGRVVAYNLQAGVSRQPAEVLGGVGHDYYGGRFYAAGTAGCAFIAGPDPGFVADHPYSWPVRQTDAPPPFITFHGTRFENFSGYLSFGSWIRGNVVLVDAGIGVNSAAGLMQDHDLEIEHWTDLLSNQSALLVHGPLDLTTAVAGAPEETYQVPPECLNYRIRCRRTALAKAAGRACDCGLTIGGLLAASCQFEVEGEGKTPWRIVGTPPANFLVPLIRAEKFTGTILPLSDVGLAVSGATAINVAGAAMALSPQSAATFAITLDNDYGYIHGQRVRLMHDGSGPGDRILSFAKNGTGMKLSADLTLRRAGEYLELEYSAYGTCWVERAYMGQGA